MTLIQFNGVNAVLGAFSFINQGSFINGFDGYILENNSFVFYYPIGLKVMLKTITLPNNKVVADVLTLGAFNDIFILAFKDSIFKLSILTTDPEFIQIPLPNTF